jgi:hypothetical protein
MESADSGAAGEPAMMLGTNGRGLDRMGRGLRQRESSMGVRWCLSAALDLQGPLIL